MRVEPELPDHPKYLRLKRRVGDFAMEALIRIWAHCQQNGRGEFWARADAEYLELIAGWEGEPGLLYRSLTDDSIHLVEIVEGGILVHDWNEMNKQIVGNWKNGPKGGRPRTPGKHSENNPLVNPPETHCLTSGSAANGNGLVAISVEQPGNPLVNPIPNSVNPPETHREPYQRNVTEHNETKLEGGPGETPMRFDLAEQAIAALNQATGAQFRGTKLELDLATICLARVGNDLPGVIKMIARQKALWAHEPRLRACLQPRTLFDPEKFDGYYAQRDLPVTATDPTTRRRELEEQILKSPANRQSTFHRADASPADQDHLKKLRRELGELSSKNYAPA